MDVAEGNPAEGADTHGSDGGLLPVPGGWVSDVGPQEDDGLLEHWRPAGGSGSVRGQGSDTAGPLTVPVPSLRVTRVPWLFMFRVPHTQKTLQMNDTRTQWGGWGVAGGRGVNQTAQALLPADQRPGGEGATFAHTRNFQNNHIRINKVHSVSVNPGLATTPVQGASLVRGAGPFFGGGTVLCVSIPALYPLDAAAPQMPLDVATRSRGAEPPRLRSTALSSPPRHLLKADRPPAVAFPRRRRARAADSAPVPLHMWLCLLELTLYTALLAQQWGR